MLVTDSEPDLSQLETRQRQTWDSQQRYLAAYGVLGTVIGASEAAGINQRTVTHWQQGIDGLQGDSLPNHLLPFKSRYEEAKIAFSQQLESLMFGRLLLPTGNRGSDILLIFALKAHLRPKYGDVTIAADDTAADLLRELKKRGRAGKKAPETETTEVQEAEAIVRRKQGPGG